MKVFSKIALSALAFSAQMFAAQAVSLSSSNPQKLQITPSCSDGTYEWRIQEKAADGVFSDTDHFWFPPNPSWTTGTYHITASENCPGASEPTEVEFDATITPDACPAVSQLTVGGDAHFLANYHNKAVSEANILDNIHANLQAVHPQCKPNSNVSYKWFVIGGVTTTGQYMFKYPEGVYSDTNNFWFPPNHTDFPAGSYLVQVTAMDNVNPSNTSTAFTIVNIAPTAN